MAPKPVGFVVGFVAHARQAVLRVVARGGDAAARRGRHAKARQVAVDLLAELGSLAREGRLALEAGRRRPEERLGRVLAGVQQLLLLGADGALDLLEATPGAAVQRERRAVDLAEAG